MLSEENKAGGSITDLHEIAWGESEFLDLLEFSRGPPIISTFGTTFHQLQLPYAKALMRETNVTFPIVRPIEIDENRFVAYGGKGFLRDDPPKVEVRRSSIWEDYFTSSNATATAFVDGVGTISP